MKLADYERLLAQKYKIPNGSPNQRKRELFEVPFSYFITFLLRYSILCIAPRIKRKTRKEIQSP